MNVVAVALTLLAVVGAWWLVSGLAALVAWSIGHLLWGGVLAWRVSHGTADA